MRENKDYLITEKPSRALLIFSIPMIIGNLFQQAYTIVDSAIVGRYVGETALAAVGASYALTSIFICIAIGGGIGASVIISHHFGGHNYGRMKTGIRTALLSFLFISWRHWIDFQPANYGGFKYTGRCNRYCCNLFEYLFFGTAILIYVQHSFFDV